ncbi:alpha/beta hydrolase [Svornostia abyssi]|uniref:Alpha/beta hydrolase n=1 Tax=Svornostia abyssi TaxID=2898438 RepID=A0ABY5PNK5_9ACTN|nr:alpha/beta hydrolase [Parviterribacteraceae bacterium J379]
MLHGWQGSQGPHWQRWLAPHLRAAGCVVSLPELPDAMTPRLDAWRATLDQELADLAAGPGERLVVCHSLGCILWLHHAAAPSPGAPHVDRVLLNAPPGPLGELPTFFPVDVDATAVAAAAGSTRLVCSDDDPYCPEGAQSSYAEPLGLPLRRAARPGTPERGRRLRAVARDARLVPGPASGSRAAARRLSTRHSGAKKGVEA